jgi:signaling intermediate in Toll pathway protein
MFERALSEGETLENFIEVLETFNKNNRPRRGHMDLLRTSMEFMDRFGLEGDLEAYNALFNVFPRERFKNRTLFDAIWPKRHPQVDLALEILTKMEENVVKPSLETYDLCEEIFGKASQPVQKCRRLAYWFTKLEEMFPHPLPKVLPEDEVELSKLALARMTKDPIPIVLYQV